MKILPTNDPPGTSQTTRNREGSHEELEAPCLIGNRVPRGPRCHVAQDHVVRGKSAESVIVKR